MSKEDLDTDDDFVDDEEPAALDDTEELAQASKNPLTKRRIIDNLLDERRLNKELADYDFNLE